MGSSRSKKLVPQKSKLKKDPGLPKLPQLTRKAKGRATSAPHVPTTQRDSDTIMASRPTFSTLVQSVAETEARHAIEKSVPNGQMKTKEPFRKRYLKPLLKVIDESDIIVLVLDARDPEGCRSRLVEEEVRKRVIEGKRLVFVMNKIDLVPKANAQAWLKYLRHTAPTLPFFSSSANQHQRTNISSTTAPALMKLLKSYKPKAGTATIGIVGYPNVGKSSLINSLKRSKVCGVAAQAGHTKDVQSIQLEKELRILDSPGIVFDDDDFDGGKGSKKGNILLRNVVKVEDIEDPLAVVEEIVARTPPELLQSIYKIPQYNSSSEFLTVVALTNGRLLKGGVPGLLATARQVLNDWNQQKIPYFSEPPVTHPSLIPSTLVGSGGEIPSIAPGAENVGQARIVSRFSQPFRLLEGLFGAADAHAFGDDESMDVDEDGDMFYDALEELMEEETASFNASLFRQVSEYPG